MSGYAVHMRALRSLLPSVIAGVTFAAPALAQSPAAILEQAVTAYRSATTMRLTFEQTLSNPLTGTTLTSHGELLRKKPNLLSINFEEGKDRVVADGKTLWVYLPSSAPGQVIKTPTSGASGTFIDPLGQVLTAPAEKFSLVDAGTATIRTRATHAVTLTPKKREDGALFTKATVWVDDKDGIVRQIETTEPSGVTRHIVVTKFATNVTIPSSAFKFTPSADLRIVNGR